MAKHTPAPWGVSTQSANTIKQFDVLGETNVIIASVMGGKTSGPFFVEDDGEVAANTLLIAAAPELLEALRELDECYCEAGNDLSKEDRHRHRMTLIKARAAIAKATGQFLKGEE